MSGMGGGDSEASQGGQVNSRLSHAFLQLGDAAESLHAPWVKSTKGMMQLLIGRICEYLLVVGAVKEAIDERANALIEYQVRAPLSLSLSRSLSLSFSLSLPLSLFLSLSLSLSLSLTCARAPAGAPTLAHTPRVSGQHLWSARRILYIRHFLTGPHPHRLLPCRSPITLMARLCGGVWWSCGSWQSACCVYDDKVQAMARLVQKAAGQRLPSAAPSREVGARWVTLRARWVDAESSLGDAKSSLGGR
jgi:hypothetical protein